MPISTRRRDERLRITRHIAYSLRGIYQELRRQNRAERELAAVTAKLEAVTARINQTSGKLDQTVKANQP